tara:strand:- start:58 stop:432 length:375 start_codon:yes stop_codon:yes gene_type:complete
MSIVKLKQKEKGITENQKYDIAIDLECLGLYQDAGWKFHPCRLRAVNKLYENGQKIIIFTTQSMSGELLDQIKELKYHRIIFNHVECDFIVSNKSREQIPFFNELFDRDYKIEPLPYLIDYVST